MTFIHVKVVTITRLIKAGLADLSLTLTNSLVWTNITSIFTHSLGPSLFPEQPFSDALSQWDFVLSSGHLFQFLLFFTEMLTFFFMFGHKFINRFKILRSIICASHSRCIFNHSRVLDIRCSYS